VSPGQSEDCVDALCLECPGNDLASVYLCHDPTLFEEGGQTQVDARIEVADPPYRKQGS
jgi:hypothetical protein